jgi:hypothetical protein
MIENLIVAPSLDEITAATRTEAAVPGRSEK